MDLWELARAPLTEWEMIERAWLVTYSLLTGGWCFAALLGLGHLVCMLVRSETPSS